MIRKVVISLLEKLIYFLEEIQRKKSNIKSFVQQRRISNEEWISNEEKKFVFAVYKWDGWYPRDGSIGKTTADGKFSCACCEWANWEAENDWLGSGIVHFWINWCKPPGVAGKCFFPSDWLQLRDFCERRHGCHLSAEIL